VVDLRGVESSFYRAGQMNGVIGGTIDSQSGYNARLRGRSRHAAILLRNAGRQFIASEICFSSVR
jgi:hypothetical protein